MPFKSIRFLHLLLIFSLAFALTACRDTPKADPVAAGAVVLAFGDSVTYGTGAGKGEDYPTRLAQRSGWNVVNAGIPGDTTGVAKDRIAELLEQHAPALVIVELGGNDFLRRVPDQTVKENLRQIVRTAKKSGARTVLVAVPELSLLRVGAGRLSDAAMYAELAKEENVLLIKDVFSDVLSNAALRADQIHPNANGYRILADGITEALVKHGLLPRR